MREISSHALVAASALFLTLCCNAYFLTLLAPSLSGWELVGAVSLLFALLGLSLELMAIGWMRKPVLIVLLLIAGSSAYPINSLKVGITPDLIHSIMQTNSREITETLNASFLWGLCVLGILPSVVVVWLKVRSVSFLKRVRNKLGFLLGYIGLVTLCWMAVGKEVVFTFKQNRALYFVINPISPIRSAIQYLGDQSKHDLVYVQVALDAKLKASHKSKIIVLIIGESARSANFSLNGYEKNTNPYTAKQSNLVSFKNFSSCGVITAISVPCMLTDYTHQTYSKRYLSDFRDNLLTITERVGIQTYYIGNNGGGCIGNICSGLPSNQVKLYADGYFDEVMLEDLERILKQAKGDTFVILHQSGSHGQSYFKRYPMRFRHFLPTCDTAEIQNCPQSDLVNTYDNTLLYTDFFISESIQRLRGLQGEFDVALWYISDHGESLGENGMYMHGGLPYFLSPKTQTQIPSILWLGEGFSWAYEKAKARENDALSHDYVFHTFFTLWGIESEAHDARLDLLH